MKEGRVALRAGDSLDHLEEVIGPVHAERLRHRLSQTDVFAGDRIEYDFHPQGSSLSIVSDNHQRATKYFDDLNRIGGPGLFAEMATRTFRTEEQEPSRYDGVDVPESSEERIERLSYVKAIKDAYDATRMKKTLDYFEGMNRGAMCRVPDGELPGEGWLRFAARLPFKDLRVLVRATVADMRSDLAEARSLGACKQAERDGRVALFKIVASVVWDLVKSALALGKVVQEIRRLMS